MGDGRGRPGRDGGRARPPRPRAGRAAGCTRPTRTASTSGRWSAGTRSASPPPPTSTPLLAIDADCVVYSPLFADPAVVTRILESGKNVVTPLGWFYPPDEERARFDAVCRAAGRHAARHRHPPRRHHRAVPAGASRRCRARSPTSGPRSSPTSAPTALPTSSATGCCSARRPSRRARASWPTPSAPGSASRCGWSPPSSASTSTRSCAPPTRSRWPPTPIDSPIGPIEPGLVAAQRFRWEGLVDGEPVITAAVNWLMGDEHLDPPWALRARGRALRGRGHRRPRHRS